MARKCFISFKTEDLIYKQAIQDDPRIVMIDKSLNDPIDSDDEDYIMQTIRGEYLSDSTVTIHLIGSKSAGHLGDYEQRFIKRELQASLYDGENNPRSGILGIVLPGMYDKIYGGGGTCNICGAHHNWVFINNETTVSEFHYNYYIPHNKCSHNDNDRYCVLVRWDEFLTDPTEYIEQAFLKRKHPIADKVKVRP
jgi:hypothetical protein